MALFRKARAPKSGTNSEKPALLPIVSLIAADLALRTGDRLVRRGVERGLLKGQPAKTARVIRGRTLTETVIGTVLAEVARRSVPGAILVGGGLLAKALRDRRLAKKTPVATPEPDSPARSTNDA